MDAANQPETKGPSPRESVQSVKFQLEAQIRQLEQRLDLSDQRLRSELERKIREEVKNGISDEVKLKTKFLAVFAAGFFLFVTIGLLQRETLFKPVVKFVYPPQDIYKEITKDVESNVWMTMKTGDRAKFSEVLTNGSFYPALRDSFKKDIVNTFGTVQEHSKVAAESVMYFGEMSVPAIITAIDKKYEGKETNCQRNLQQNELQAVIVLPASATDADYRWFGCTANYPELTELKLVVDGKEVEGVSLVGVERNGVRPELEVRVTAKAASLLDVQGHTDYSTLKMGKVSVSKADD